jgi:hypothetical protein
VGFDLAALARVASCVGVDRDETHAICAAHNSGAPTVVADVRDLRLDAAGAVYVDPARREGDRRGGSEPPLPWCFAIPAARVAVKAAPGLALALVPPGWEAEFVAEGRALKEACLWSPAWASVARRATVLRPDGPVSLVRTGPEPVVPVAAPGAFVLDPSPAVTRAGLVADLAAALEAWQVDARIAFLTADQPLQSPFGRSLAVVASMPFAVKPLAAELRRLGIGTVDLRRRGLAGDVEDLRRRLRLRGDRRATVLLTRVGDRPWTLVCTDAADA